MGCQLRSRHCKSRDPRNSASPLVTLCPGGSVPWLPPHSGDVGVGGAGSPCGLGWPSGLLTPALPTAPCSAQLRARGQAVARLQPLPSLAFPAPCRPRALRWSRPLPAREDPAPRVSGRLLLASGTEHLRPETLGPQTSWCRQPRVPLGLTGAFARVSALPALPPVAPSPSLSSYSQDRGGPFAHPLPPQGRRPRGVSPRRVYPQVQTRMLWVSSPHTARLCSPRGRSASPSAHTRTGPWGRGGGGNMGADARGHRQGEMGRGA